MIRTIRYGNRLVQYIEPQDVINILNEFSNRMILFRKKKSWFERYILVSFIFWLGLRANECLNLKRKDINLAKRIVQVDGIEIFMDHIPTYVLEEWEKFLAKKNWESNIFSYRSRFGVYRAVREFFELFGIKNVNPRMLRNSIAIFLSRKGIPINGLAKLLRVKKIESLAIFYIGPKKEVCIRAMLMK